MSSALANADGHDDERQAVAGTGGERLRRIAGHRRVVLELEVAVVVKGVDHRELAAAGLGARLDLLVEVPAHLVGEREDVGGIDPLGRSRELRIVEVSERRAARPASTRRTRAVPQMRLRASVSSASPLPAGPHLTILVQCRVECRRGAVSGRSSRQWVPLRPARATSLRRVAIGEPIHVRILRIPHPSHGAALGCAARRAPGVLLAFRAPDARPVRGHVRDGALRRADRHPDPGLHRQARHADGGGRPRRRVQGRPADARAAWPSSSSSGARSRSSPTASCATTPWCRA